MGVVVFLLNGSATYEPWMSKLVFLVNVFGQSAPSCSHTSIIWSLSHSSNSPVNTITCPAKGPTFYSLGLDLGLLFPSFFCSDTGVTGASCLIALGISAFFSGKRILFFPLGFSSYLNAYSSSTSFLFGEDAVRLSFIALSINKFSS